MYTESLEIHDPRFKKLVFGNVHLEKVWTGGRWSEGPAYFPAGRYLVWSDIPNDRVMRLDEDGRLGLDLSAAGATSQRPHGRPAGAPRQLRTRGPLRVAGGARRVGDDPRRPCRRQAAEFPERRGGQIDDSVWFTDPTYGIDSEYEGGAAPSETDGSHVYRIDPRDGRVHAVALDFRQPNGLCFSPDERRLYIADTGATHSEDGPRHIRASTWAPTGSR